MTTAARRSLTAMEEAVWRAGYVAGVQATRTEALRRINKTIAEAKTTLRTANALWRQVIDAADYAALDPDIEAAVAKVDANFKSDPRA